MLKKALFLQAIWLFLYLSIEVRSQEFAPDPEPLKYCAHPTSPENGLVQCSYANNIAQQFLCRFTCNDGYKFKDRPDKSISIFCLNGTYGFSQSSTVPPCVPICEDPDIPPFVTFSCINDGNGGKTCTAQCQPSYKFQSPPASSYVCHKGGIWSPDLSQVPKCMPSPGIVTDSGLATCSVWGDNHYRTFDSKVYSFNGQCKYILAYEPNIFDIMVVHDPACKSGENCGRSVQIYFSDNTIVLGATSNGSVVQWNGKDFSVPGSRASTVVEKVGHYITVRSALQFTVKWDGKNSIFVKVSDELKGKVRGLCGKFNGNPLDDFETEAGNLVTSVASFGSSWKRAELTDGIYCQDSAQSLGCWAANATSKQRASSKCIDLAIDPDFQPCHLVVDPRPYQKLCKDDCCGSDKEECMCETMEAYSRACMDYGVKLAWRKSGRCEIQCPDTMVYKECGSSCVPDCSNADATCSDQTCVDGCFCPDGWVLHDEKCVPVEQCPCPHGGKEYRPGDHITEECNTCTCELGKWNCTRESCDAQCSVVGHSHYTTFDGKTYDFVGYCSYYLMTNPEFHVVVDNIRCGNEGSACIKSVSIEINHQYVKLERNNRVFLDGHEVSNLPYQSTHVKISMMSSVFIQVVLDNGISISWDGRSRLYVIAPPSLKGLTRGLCGTYDGKQKMDFLTPQGSLETNANIFGNQYRTVKTCSNMPNYIYDDPCSMQKERKPKAEQFCKLLKGPLFQACHDIEDVNRYYENCMYDLCSCSENLHDCLCPSLGAYADLCAAKGVIIPWRQNVKECTLSCPGGQEYQVCGKKCERTCQDLAQNGGDSCDHQCVEGCNCPRGQSVDDQGECVPAEECPCIFDGRTYAASFKTLMGTELCECRGAKWQCSRISFSENIAQVEPLCPETMEFSSCAAKCSVTCENMNNPQACDETECKPSCVCKDGYVLDGDKCVAPSMCPCHHAGKAYYEGDTYFDDCNECVCKEQRWECEQKDCPSTCSAYGDSHYKTFDGLQYEFQGSCDYIMAQSTRNNPDKFVITTANMKCGTSGVTCSKGIELILGEEGTFSFYRLQLVRGKDPNPDPGSPFDVKEVGEMVYVTTPIGVTIQWDRGTRVYITLSPKHMNMVEGLCGNFNGDLKDDFGLPSSGPPAARAITFGFSWRVHSYCTKSEEIEDTCSKAPQRRTWAHHRCSVLGSELFRPCHAVVEPSDYIKRCEFDACACDMGGDCECLCTAIAAYAHECATKGVHIKWRSKDLCGLACEDCQEYNPCMSLCPKKTCDNRLFYERISQNCENEQNVCFEGCDLHPCPAGQVYDSLVEPVTCIPEPLCDSPACEINGKKYREGERIDDPHVCNSMCEICNCRNGELEHITFGNCEHVIVTLHPPANTTITPTTDDTPAINCLKQGWTSWMSATIPTHDNIGDQETVAGLRNKYSFCHEDQITDIRCRVISQPEYGMYFGQKVTCNLESGLTCHHKDQNGGMCLDYEVSYNCDCSKTTHHSDTTAFSTTISTLSTMETTKQVSLTEISTTTISTPTVSYTTGKNSTQYTSATSPPASSTPRPPVKSCGWTQWMNSGTPSQKGDLESMSNLRMVYSFCDYPVNIACRTVPDAKFPHGISYDKTRQMGITCSLNGGLVCLNSVQVYGQKCYDYEVAVRCVDGCRSNTDKTTIEPLTMPSHSTQESTPTLPLWSSTTGHNVYTYSLSTLGYTENMTNTFSTAKTSTTSETTPSFETSAHIHSSSPVFISTSSLASTSSTSPKVSSTSTATFSTTSHNSSPKSSSPSTSTSSILFSSDSTLTESSTSPTSSTMYPTSSTHSVHSSTSPPVSKSSSTRSHDSSTTSLHTSTVHSNIPFSSSSGKSYFTSSTIDTSSSTGSTPSSTRTDILSSVSTSESSSTSTATSTSSTNPTKVTSPTSPSSSPSPTSSTTASTSSSINPSSSSINPDTTGILITNTYKTTFSTDQTTKNEKIVTSQSSSNPATASTGSSSAASTTLSTVINQETSSLSLTTSNEGTSTSSTEGPVSSYSEKTTTSVTDIKSKVCDDLFGLYSYSIASNDQFEASSSTGAAFDAHNARLNNLHSGQSNGGSWVPRPSDRAPYLLIDLKHPETISGVVTQGRHDAPEWVTKYIVSTSLDGKHFSPYSEEKDQSPKIFTANHDSNTPVKALFNREVVASKIKIFPLEFFNAPALRIDLLTCDGFATLTTLTTPDQGTTTANSRESEKTTPIIRTSDETSKESDKTTPTIRTSDETTRESDKTTPTIRTSDETTRESDKTTPTIRTSDETTRESDKTSPRIRTSDETTRESDKTTPTIRTSDETTRESDKTSPRIRTSDETTRESDKTTPRIRTSDETTRESDKTTPTIRTSDETTRESDKTTPTIRTSDETTRESDKTIPTIRTSDETTRESDKTTPTIRTSDETTRESDKTSPRIRTSDETTRESDKTTPTIRTSDETTRESDKTSPRIRTSDETTRESDKTTPTIRTSDETTRESDKTSPRIRTSDETTRESDKTTPRIRTSDETTRESDKTTPTIRTSDETTRESDKTTPTIRTSDETTRESDKTIPTIRTSDETTRESDKTTPTIRTSDETTRESDKTSPRIRTSDETTRESDKTTPTIRTSDETTRESDKTTPTIRTSDETTRESDKTKPTIRTSDETTRESDKTTPAIRTSDETTRESDKTTPRIRTSDETTRESDKTSPTIRTSDETTRESDKTTPTIRTSDETTSESDKTTPTIRTSDETTTGESDKTTPTIRTSDETTRESDKTTPTIKTSDETTRESDKTSPRIRTSDETTPRESDKTTPTIRTSDETTRESDKTTPTLPATTQENITTVRTEQRFSTSTSPMVTSSTEKSSQTTIQISEKSSIITAKITTPSWSTSTTSNTRPECTKSYWLPWTNRNIPNGINGDKEFLSTTELASLCNGTITRAKCATETGVPEYMTGEIVTCDLENGLVCMNEENGHRCLDYGITYWCQCGKSNTNFTQGPDTTTLSSTAAESTSSLPSSPMSTGTTKHEKDTTATTPQPSSSEITKKEGPTTTPIHITTDENSVPPSSSSTDFGFSSTMDSSQHSSVGENSTPTLPRQSTTELSDIFTTTVPDSTSSSATSPTRLRIRCAWSPWLNTDQPRITKTDKGDMETIDALKSKFGICPNMVDIECRVANSTTSAMDAGQFGVQCDVINGLRCYNRDTKEGLCYDYEVRVLCWDDQVCKGTTPLPPSETTSPTDFYRHTTVVCPPGKEWQPCAYKCNEVCHYKGGISGSCSKELLGDCVPGCKSVVPDKHIECPPNSRLIDDSTCVETSVCTCLKPDGSAAKPLEIWTNPRNPCSRCSCFNNQVICDSSDECTTGQSTTATTTVSSATSTTSLPRMPLCGWSSWINDDKPNTGSGDMELLSAMQSKYGFCAQPTSVECRPIARQSLDVLHLQVQATCNVLEGLKCYNHNNKNRCPDYEIRIFCPCPTVNVSRSTSTMSTVEQTRTSERSSVTSPTTSSSTSGVSSTEPTLSTTASMTSTTVPTESSTKSSVTSTQPLVTIKESESSSTEFTTHTYRMCGWTDWMSNSHLNPSGDIENLSGLRKNHVFCENSAILAIRCRDVKTHKSAEELGQKNVRCDLDMGLLCLNSEQDDSSKCADYEVSYFCEPVGVDCSDVIQTTLANKWTDTTPSVTSVVSSIFDQSTTTSINSRTSTVKVDITPVSDTTSTLGHSTTMLYSTNVTQSITSVHENMTGYTKDTWTTSVDTSSPPTFSESTSTTVPECKNPLLLTNSYLSASSSLSLYTGPDRSRLDTHHDTFHTGAWMPKVNNDEQWIKVTFPQPMMITAITTQGRESAPEWVKTYKIIYSSDNSTFHSIQTENGQSRIFLGNTDSNTKHTESVEPTLASVIFIEPQTWMNRIALRFEIHGCYGLPPTNDTVNTTGSTPTTPTEVTPPHESLVPEMCLKEMGMLDHRVTANMLSASSFRDFAHAPYKARLGEDKSWIPAAYDRSPYIQVNFGEQQIISGVTTQGKPDAPVYVKTFKVFYSNDGIKWVPLRDTPQSDKIFYANWDSVTPVTNFFLRPLRAQFFRIQPLRWNNGIALRFELHGCPVSIFTTTEATTLKADTSKTTLSTAMSTTSMPVTETREKCVEWDQWIDLNHPSLSSPNDVEPISDLISQSLHCSNPVAIECRTATPSQLTPSESGQNVTCNLLEGLKCLSKDVKEPICHNFEARIGCVKEVPECLQQSTLPPPVQLCYPGIDAHHCPQSCPQGTYCDGYKCVIKSDCPCILDQKIVRPSGVERNENCGICQCLNGEIYCMPPTQCPTCIQGYRYRNRTSCECECLMCDVDEFQCGDTTCIPKLKQCDGVVDCIDDELGCEQTTVFTPPSTTAKAHNGSTTHVVTPSQTTHDFRTTASKEMVSTTTARTSVSTPEPPKHCHFLQTTKTVGGVDVKLAVSQEIVHKIGEKWSDGLCRSCSCASGVNGDTKVFCTEEDCTPCKVGERRMKKAGSCCGVCEPYGCVVDGLVYKAGEVLRSKKKCYTSKCQKDLHNKAFIIQETQVECERMENLTPCSPGSSASEHYDASGCCLVCVPPNLWHNATSSVCETCTPRLVTGDSSKTVGYFKITLESGAYCYNMSPIPDLKQCDGYCGSTSIYTEVMQGFESHCKCCQPNTTTAVAVQLKCSDGQFLTKHYDVPETCACMPCSGKI